MTLAFESKVVSAAQKHCAKYIHDIHVYSFSAEFEKCSLSIHNGQLTDDCGPGTDWVCDLECNEGFHKHSFTINRHNGFESSEMTRGLYCESGAWKSGFEHFGITASQLCVPDGKSMSFISSRENRSLKHLS